jgi:CBS domain-containing protein
VSRCRDLMTDYPLLCLPGDPVGKAVLLLSKHDTGPVLIIESEVTRKLAGIVTERDLALKVVAQGRNPDATKVQEVMSRDTVVCRADDDVQKALEIMAKFQLLRIPVVDHSDRVLGIIAHTDLDRHINRHRLDAEAVKGMLQAPSSMDEPEADNRIHY